MKIKSQFTRPFTIKLLTILTLGVLTIFIFFLVKHFSPGTPTNLTDGYHGWFDQQQYYLIAKDITNAEIRFEHFLYPLGFPLVGAPFISITPIDPFIIPNLLLFLISTIYIFLTLKNFTSNYFISVLGALVFIFGTSVSQQFVSYWTTNIGIVSSVFLLYIMSFKEVKLKYSLSIGFILGYYFFTRTYDVIFYLPLIPFYFLNSKEKHTLKNIAKQFLAISIFPLIFITIQTFQNYLVFGNPLITPYSRHEAAKMDWFVPENFISNWFGMLLGTNIIDENRIYPPMLKTNIIPLLLFIFNSLVLIKSKFKDILLLPYSVIIIYFTFYGSYLFFSMENVKYGSERFITPILPIIIVISMIQFAKLVDSKYLDVFNKNI